MQAHADTCKHTCACLVLHKAVSKWLSLVPYAIACLKNCHWFSFYSSIWNIQSALAALEMVTTALSCHWYNLTSSRQLTNTRHLASCKGPGAKEQTEIAVMMLAATAEATETTNIIQILAAEREESGLRREWEASHDWNHVKHSEPNPTLSAIAALPEKSILYPLGRSKLGGEEELCLPLYMSPTPQWVSSDLLRSIAGRSPQRQRRRQGGLQMNHCHWIQPLLQPTHPAPPPSSHFIPSSCPPRLLP